jgi:hypothetical protein
MGYVRVALCVALIPLLVASAQDRSQFAPAVRKLLRKPRQGLAKVTRLDGTTTQDIVLRVTNQFVAVGDGKSCENIPLSSIADFGWQPVATTTKKEILESILLWPLYLLILIGAEDPPHYDGPTPGIWESVHPSPDGSFKRISISDFVSRTDVSIRKGRYRIEDQNLVLGTAETLPIHFKCASLLLDAVALTLDPKDLRRAGSPIVGRWHSEAGQQTWEFRPDGTFQKEVFSQVESGLVQKTETGFNLQFRETGKPFYEAKTLYQEDWKVRTAHDHLFITRNGETVEYRPVPYF